MSKAELSVITVNLNNRHGLERTINSVRELEFRDFEYVIIDGGSNDGSLELIKKNSDLVDRYVSEPDSGIYSAMNKAASLASGKYMLFLNSGDYFANPRALDELDLQTGEDLIYGNHTFHDPVTGKTAITQYDGILDLGFFWRTTMPQCSTFINKLCLADGGWFNEDYPIAADWVFFCKALLERGCSARHLDRSISIFELGGVSTSKANKTIVNDERNRFMKSFLPVHVYDYMLGAESIRQENLQLARDLRGVRQELEVLKRKGLKYRSGQLLKRFKRRLDAIR